MATLNGYLTPAEAADLLGVSIASVRGWCRANTIECVRSGRNWFIPQTAVDSVLAAIRPTNLYTKPYLTISEAAHVLNLKRRTLERWCYRGKVPTIRQGRKLMIARKTIHELMAELMEQFQA